MEMGAVEDYLVRIITPDGSVQALACDGRSQKAIDCLEPALQIRLPLF